MVESWPFIEYCCVGYVQVSVAIAAVVVAFVLGLVVMCLLNGLSIKFSLHWE